MGLKTYKTLAFAYLCMPLLMFFSGFLKLTFGLVLCAVLLFVFMEACASFEDGRIDISKNVLIAISVVLLAWCIFGGQGGFWYQSSDWDIRNAIFRDLVNCDWPVIYENKSSALCYYVGHWLVPAVIAKPFLFFGQDFAWIVASIALLCWTWAGTLLIFLGLIAFVSNKFSVNPWIIVLFFVFFSGLDIVGVFAFDRFELLEPAKLHIEWWTRTAQFSSLTTCLFWVFNQAIAGWLGTILFLNESNTKLFGLIFVGVLICAPFCALGLAILMLFKMFGAIFNQVSKQKLFEPSFRCSTKETFGLINLPTMLVILPILVLYFLSNAATSGITTGTEAAIAHITKRQAFWFLLIEVGVYLLLDARLHFRNPLFWGISFVFLICPFLHVGTSADFCMRVSIPAVFVLMVFCLETLLQAWSKRQNSHFAKLKVVALSICLLLGAATPALEFYRGFYNISQGGILHAVQDVSKSLGEIKPSINFEAFDYEDKVFFKYLAK